MIQLFLFEGGKSYSWG